MIFLMKFYYPGGPPIPAQRGPSVRGTEHRNAAWQINSQVDAVATSQEMPQCFSGAQIQTTGT